MWALAAKGLSVTRVRTLSTGSNNDRVTVVASVNNLCTW